VSNGIDERARLIALDLVALYHDGAIRAADHPEARFYARVMVLFDGRYAGKASPETLDPLPSTQLIATRQVIAPKLPALEDLAPELEKLEIYPNSIVLIAIEDCRVTWGWFSAAERKALRAALERARKRRGAAENKFSRKDAQRS
jgi:hypothetical protein